MTDPVDKALDKDKRRERKRKTKMRVHNAGVKKMQNILEHKEANRGAI